MPLPRLIERLLAEWRLALRRTAASTRHTDERGDAERAERRARSAYQDESIRQHGSRDIQEESRAGRINRLNDRAAELKRDSLTDQARADDAEIERELRPSD